MDKKWYVLRCPSGQEEKIAQWLLMHTRISHAVTPMEILLHRRVDGSYRERRRPIFPGYIFIQVALTPLEYYHIAFNNYRQVTFLGKEGSQLVEAVPDNEMDMVLYLWQGGEDFGISRGYRGEDGKVHVTEGPLAPLQDKVIIVNARQKVAALRLHLHGKPHSIRAALEIEKH